MSAPEETLPQKLEAVRKSLPPHEGRRSRLGHPSKDDFADAIGVTRTRIYVWYRGEGYPDTAAAERLAFLSGGRYSASDFKNPANGATPRAATLAELAVLIQAARQDQERQWGDLRELAGEVSALGEDVRGIATDLAGLVSDLTSLAAFLRSALEPPDSGHGRRSGGL